MKKLFLILSLFAGVLFYNTLSAQTPNGKRPVIAAYYVESKGVIPNADAVRNLAIIELGKLNLYNVVDKFDIEEYIKKDTLNEPGCRSKSCLAQVGKALNADKVFYGSIERIGEKIIVTFKILDVQSGAVEKSDVTEYYNVQNQISNMFMVSIQQMHGIKPEPQISEALINNAKTAAVPHTALRLSGPRMGCSFTTGESGDRLTAPKNEGGFDMMPLTSQFGWQQEWQYMSSGNFQALFESVFMINGLENGKFIPSVSFFNGLRDAKSGWEIGIGPSFRFVRKADGFYDVNGLIGEKGKWRLEHEWNKDSLAINPYNIVSRLDSRGDVQLSTGLIIAVGKTFRSGYINIPVNIYCIPRKEGTIVGTSIGFNIVKHAGN